MYVKVLTGQCVGYTACSDVCPEIYKLDDRGFACVTDGPIPPDLEEKVLQGVRTCPSGAIVVSGEPFPS